MRYYSICLDLREKPCLVVGGGDVAARKVVALLDSGARVRVISPAVCPELAERAGRGEVEWISRRFQLGDVDPSFRLVIAATDDRPENGRIAAEARQRRVLVNAVDDVPNCDFIAPALVRQGDVQVAISTNGRSPAFAHWLRTELEQFLTAEYAALLDVCGDVRDELRRKGRVVSASAWRTAIGPSLIEVVRREGVAAGRQALRAALLKEVSTT
ncbi:MAG: bifunctional precorrin-2 dehydrogenase/sirohydrochlorin ferrochelatase [Chloroflexi bacterium]|nr:bifunctional precorrin-2 dehydrogenase/sirohydrochlorin ferrochelatase [Chloroflexota bacterium]